MQNVFQIVPARPAAHVTVFGIAALMLGKALTALSVATMPVKRTAALSLLAGAGLLSFLAYSFSHVRFILSEDGLEVRGDLWARAIRRSSLRPEEARLVNLNRDTDLRPLWKTCGTSVPGYLSGWFRLRNRQKALVFVTDPTQVVYVPTDEGYGVLLSPGQPEEFLAALRAGRS